MPAAVSAVAGITPRVSLSDPKAPATMRVGVAATVYGYLKPVHTAGSRPVRIYAYRNVAGQWRYYGGYTPASVATYPTYSRYACSLKLPYRGTWRLRAYAPADSRHAATWSTGYATVVVR